MGEERDRDLRDEWTEHPQTAFLGAAGDIFSTAAGRGPESPEQRAAREGAPAVEGPGLDELIERERGPVVGDFTQGARAAHDEGREPEGREPQNP